MTSASHTYINQCESSKIQNKRQTSNAGSTNRKTATHACTLDTCAHTYVNAMYLHTRGPWAISHCVASNECNGERAMLHQMNLKYKIISQPGATQLAFEAPAHKHSIGTSARGRTSPPVLHPCLVFTGRGQLQTAARGRCRLRSRSR